MLDHEAILSGEIGESVYALVSKHMGVSILRLSPKTRLAEDLGMEGDDAYEFFEEFFALFKVDGSTFKIDRHFYSEGVFRPLWQFLEIGRLIDRMILGPNNKNEGFNRISITIEDIVNSIESKKWVK